MPPRWVASCPECRKEFTHTNIGKSAAGMRDPFAWPAKPQIPEGGTQLICPKSNKPSAYRTVDLRYRAD
jgi:hypothetical protein